MQASSKIVARKQELKKIQDCKEIQMQLQDDSCAMVTEIDFSHNKIT